MNNPVMKVKKLFADAKLPVREHSTDSGVDVFAYRFEKHFAKDAIPEWNLQQQKSMLLKPNERVLINTGLTATVGEGYEIQVRPRSGNALKLGLSVLNTPGTIDESYRGMIGIILVNLGCCDQIIKVGDKIAQLVVAPVVLVPIVEVDDLDKTERNDNGFGSTGTI
jgi:dUTP pyrophosphatase